MIMSESAQNAWHHITKLGSKKLSEFVELTGPIEIPTRYGNDQLLGLARIVVGQQLSNNAATAIWERLSSRYVERSELLEALRNPETSDTGLSNSKKRTLSALVSLGDSWVSTLVQLPEDERRAALLAVWGLGPWSVAMWELFVLQNPDQWSDQDLILNRVSNQFATELMIETTAFVNRAAPFRSYLALYCWRFHDTYRHSAP